MGGSAGRNAGGSVTGSSWVPPDFDGRGFATVCTACREPLGRSFVPFCPHCGAMSDVEYDLGSAQIYDDKNPYRRFRDLLPVIDTQLLPADAALTPAVHATRLGEAVGIPWLYLKDETVLPTGTTKDRMAAVALPYLYECGVRRFCTSSTGNSSTAYAHRISRLPELVMYLFSASQFGDRVQECDTPQVIHFVLEDATFVEAFDAAKDFANRHGLVSERGFFNPGRREGLKLAWLEAVDQVPRPIDWYAQAVSSAMGVYGVYKGAKELHALNRLEQLPRLLCVQQETCAPMVTAWAEGSSRIRPQDIVHRPSGIAKAILRGNPSLAYPHVRTIVIESRGTFVAVSEREIRAARELVEDLEGLSPCFSASGAVAGAMKLRRLGELLPEETVLVNLSGRDRPEGAGALSGGHRLRRSENGWVPEDSLVELEAGLPVRLSGSPDL
jgi:threonine synthase